MEVIDDGDDKTEPDLDEIDELSRENSVSNTPSTTIVQHGNEEYSIVQIGENKELMQQKREQMF